MDTPLSVSAPRGADETALVMRGAVTTAIASRAAATGNGESCRGGFEHGGAERADGAGVAMHAR